MEPPKRLYIYMLFCIYSILFTLYIPTHLSHFHDNHQVQAMNIFMGGGASSGATQKTVLITGVSRGLGRALAIEMAKQGHAVIGCARSQESLDSLKAEMAKAAPNSSSDQHLFFTVDVRSDSSVKELARAVMEKGVPNIIVNNAGFINKNNNLWEVPVEEFDAVIDTNEKGIANMLRHFIPPMLKKKQGIIINMSSGWERSTAGEVAPYCASKWAVEGLSKSVAKELPNGIAMIALNPGIINTDLLASCFGSSPLVIKHLIYGPLKQLR